MAHETVIAADWVPFVSVAQGDANLPQNNLTGKGYARYTPTTVKKLTDAPANAGGVAIPDGARSAVLTVASNPIRFRTDATDPTASEGVLLAVGTWFFPNQREWLRALRFIDTAAGASEVTVAYGM